MAIKSRVGKIVKNNSKEAAQVRAAARQVIDAQVYAQRVEKKAYELYEKRGCQEGHACEDWLEAKRLVEQEMIAGQ